MRFFALATDYDGTIAHQGTVDTQTVDAMRRLKDSGRKLILVTGRELADLLRVFPHPELFDRIVAENGALLYRPATKEEKVLAQPPPPKFAELLREKNVKNLSVGRVIVSTYEPYETVVLDAIRELGLELQVIFNKGAVMVLPSGVNKASGLEAALADLNLSRHNIVGVGDAENDHAFLQMSECSAAVANALPALKEKSDIVLSTDHGAGVTELIDAMLANDLADPGLRLHHREIPLGRGEDGETLSIRPYGTNVLVAGSSGGGKSTLVSGLIERLIERQYQTLIVDPEGDYPELEGTLALGTAKQAPAVDELNGALAKPQQTVVANLISIRLEDKPGFFQKLFPRLTELRAQTGRPHWVVVDEVHHVLPKSWESSPAYIPLALQSVLLVTVHPEHVAPAILKQVDLVIAVGDAPDKTFQAFCEVTGRAMPELSRTKLEKGEAIAWRVSESKTAWFEAIPSTASRRRHIRKYAHGELAENDSFYFQGPAGKLRLRAQNLQMFMQLADGVDDETWLFHLQRGDYSQWMRTKLKDDELADAVNTIEKQTKPSPKDTRESVRAEIETRYTAPA